LGDSFAGGTTDGPGDFDFTQGTNSTSANPFWNFIAHFISDPTQEEIDCQAPKPILLNTGDITFPTQWTPKILSLQIFKIGELVIVAVPGEFTTMSGRRLRDTVKQTLIQNGVADNDTIVVIAGLSNDYSHYIATYEEYHYQRYEGASTLYGPHTLAAYQQLYSTLAEALAKNQPVPPGPSPPDLSGHTFSFLPGPILDGHPWGSHFGAVNQDALKSYSAGTQVKVSFWGGDPRNDYRTQDTFLTVEINKSGSWKAVRVDGDVDTKFLWKRTEFDENLITITWDIPADVTSGQYRICTFGKSRDIFGDLTPYTGCSSAFTVSA